jgi:hypothetical protein
MSLIERLHRDEPDCGHPSCYWHRKAEREQQAKKPAKPRWLDRAAKDLTGSLRV